MSKDDRVLIWHSCRGFSIGLIHTSTVNRVSLSDFKLPLESASIRRAQNRGTLASGIIDLPVMESTCGERGLNCDIYEADEHQPTPTAIFVLHLDKECVMISYTIAIKYNVRLSREDRKSLQSRWPPLCRLLDSSFVPPPPPLYFCGMRICYGNRLKQANSANRWSIFVHIHRDSIG